MKKMAIVSLIIVCTTTGAFAEVGFNGRPITNNLSMPTGYTLNQGEFTIGIGPVGFGITDNIQASTNVLLWIFQVYNVNVKFSAIKSEKSALGIGLSLYNLNLTVDDEDIDFTAFSPYISYSNSIGPKTMLHVSAKYSSFAAKADTDVEDAEAEASSEGTSMAVGVEHSISHKTKFLFEGGYDLTFEGFRTGLGFLWGWEKFRLKLGVSYYKPEGTNGFTFPNIGLWWRFQG